MTAVVLDIADAVADILLDRPDKMNAVDEAMAAALLNAVDEAEAADVRAVVVRGAGRGFCAGRDLSDADPANEDARAILAEVFNPVFQRLASIAVPTFAAVKGPALGVGLGIALACDVVYVAEDAKVGSPFARIGAVLDSGGHRHFVERLGRHRALELIYTGRLLSGVEAAAIGLVNAAVPADQLDDTVREMAVAVAAGPTAAFRLSKLIVNRMDAQHLGLADVLDAEAMAQGSAARTSDYVEGIEAFQDKRPPTFTGA